MTFVGKPVYTVWRDRYIRFGIVIEEKIETNGNLFG